MEKKPNNNKPVLFTIKAFNSPILQNYFNCPHCKYSTDRKFNYKIHLEKKHREEFLAFIASEEKNISV